MIYYKFTDSKIYVTLKQFARKYKLERIHSHSPIIHNNVI